MLRIAVTLGDPRGVGPEVVEKAISRFQEELPGVELILLGADGFDSGRAPFRSVGTWDGSESSAGRVALAAIRGAVEMAVGGDADAIVTAPIHKPALRAAGVQSAGHTELLKELTGAREVGMLMAAETTQWRTPLRVLLATTHIPLRDVARAVTADRLAEQGLLLEHALRRDWGLHEPRVAFCALNPHASDGGLFGDEEERIYAPALNALAAEGVNALGPLPADTVFMRALKGEFDAVVAPYHDVGMAAFKTVSFGTGVNVTLGLPFVRTSPDHGTAFDLAGRGLADERSMLEALRLATRLAARRRAPPGVSSARSASFSG